MKSDKILEKLQQKLKESDPTKRTLTDIFQFNFLDCDGKMVKTVVVDLKALKVFDGIANHPDAQISLTDDDFYLIGTKEITFDELIQTGKIQVQGNQESLRKIFAKFHTR